ncbi:unnamed protein product [Eruca vesicaria subsp. sativa]|uniref:Uncharacterized protein n=1 Tax=Eruca vesicaria subsp. sativa TaxID=29727 RepID=A0ABC8INF3_ERUVS|nr:unnamed protein product [Eruca vesicaria subsp. sativa]
MASSYSLLSDLKAGRCSNTAEVRLLRFSEANKVRDLISVDMLLIDEKIRKARNINGRVLTLGSIGLLIRN